MAERRVFVDTSVLVRYFVGDDPVRGFAAAALIDSDAELIVSTGVLIELTHILRTQHGLTNPTLATGLIAFLSRTNVQLADATPAAVVAGLQWSMRVSARRIPDAILAAAAASTRCEFIASFDEKLSSPSVPVRLL